MTQKEMILKYMKKKRINNNIREYEKIINIRLTKSYKRLTKRGIYNNR